MYATLAIHSRAHQNIPKREGYIGSMHKRTKGKIGKRQKACNCNKDKFLEKHSIWLDTMFKASESAFRSNQKTRIFEECSDKIKRRRIEALKRSISEKGTDLFKN